MISRPAAVPKPAGGGESVPPTNAVDKRPDEPDTQTGHDELAAEAPETSAFSDFSFSRSSLDFHVESDIDPIGSVAEEAAVLFANGQNDAAQVVLENAVALHRSEAGERLWLMLFDLYSLMGRRVPFDALSVDYARAYEKSPPGWKQDGDGLARGSSGAAGSARFKGDLVAENAAAFDAVRRSMARHARVRLELSTVTRVDAGGALRFGELLREAGRDGKTLELHGLDALLAPLQALLAAGKAENKDCWLLLLELLQRQGQQQAFEDLAIDYAVTFEESPPSWEAARVDAALAGDYVAADGEADEEAAGWNGAGDTYVLSGEINSSRFDELSPYVQARDLLLLDCSRLLRMDFVSAGALLNVLTRVRSAGKQIVFRHPNRLVGELFRVVGLNAVATIVFARN